MSKRIQKVIKELNREGAQAFLVTNQANLRYLSGFRGEDAVLLIMPRERFLITDSRYRLQAKRDTSGFSIKIIDGPLIETLAKLVKSFKIRRLGFEYGHMRLRAYDKLKGYLSGTVLTPLPEIIEGLRRIKDADELRLIRESVLILERAIVYFRSILKPGMTESDLAAETEYFIRAAGGQRSAFEIIVASGENSALPHAISGNRPVKDNDIVLLDLGVDYDGYKSDLTRVFFLGRIDRRHKHIYSVVKEAQRRAIEAIRPGVAASKIDGIARSYIRKKGFGSYFGHSLGHGIGLEVHESPAISESNHAVLKPGMVFTIEPAIYLSNLGGVRIEDMVLVTNRGCKVLTNDINK